MTCYRFIPAAALAVLLCASSASAILIKTGGMEIGGYLVRADAKKLTIRILSPSGQEEVTEFSRSKVDIIHELNLTRLAGLTKDNPKAYRDYADELAKK